MHRFPTTADSRSRAAIAVLAVTAVLLQGCAGGPRHDEGPRVSSATRPGQATTANAPLSLGTAVAGLAVDMVGTRYRYGGADPGEGFDCSGLVFYTYSQAGQSVPRTSQEQFKAARKIALGAAAPGDVVFFQDQEKLSHVGIYLGDGLFVHAPATGQSVAVASIESPYYQRHLVAVGRLLQH